LELARVKKQENYGKRLEEKQLKAYKELLSLENKQKRKSHSRLLLKKVNLKVMKKNHKRLS
jgi:hypothetical protein